MAVRPEHVAPVDPKRVEQEVMNAYYNRDPEALRALIRKLLERLMPQKGPS